MSRASCAALGLLGLFAGCTATPEVAAAAGGTAASDPAPAPAGNVTALAGALLLHQFPAGGHSSLIVVDHPVGVADFEGREPFSLPYPTVVRQGPCRLYQNARCTPACADGQLCTAPQVCTPISPLLNIDIGEVRVTGGQLSPLIRFWFVAPSSPYDSDPEPGPTNLFAGGERLTVTGGRGAYTLNAHFPAPIPVAVLAPSPQGPLHLPVHDAFTLRWRPEGGSLMAIWVDASRTDQSWGAIRCLVPDSGEFTVPASLMAALPPPPRDVHYELERDEEVLQPLPQLGPGVGMLAHAAFTAWQNGNDPG
jgi:hypothetical protein